MKIRSILFLSILIIILNACNKGGGEPAGTINQLDARYRMEGTLFDKTNATYTWPGDTFKYDLVTMTPTQIKLVSKDLGIDGHLVRVGGSLSFYGTFGLLVNFDPATNKITSVTNSYGQPSANMRSAVLDPSGINTWDPVTKNIKIKYWMDETGVTGHRTSFDETWIYIGPR